MLDIEKKKGNGLRRKRAKSEERMKSSLLNSILTYHRLIANVWTEVSEIHTLPDTLFAMVSSGWY